MGEYQQQIVASLVRASIVVCFTGLTVERAQDGWVLGYGLDGYKVELANGERTTCPDCMIGIPIVTTNKNEVIGTIWTARNRELADREALAAKVYAEAIML